MDDKDSTICFVKTIDIVQTMIVQTNYKARVWTFKANQAHPSKTLKQQKSLLF